MQVHRPGKVKAQVEGSLPSLTLVLYGDFRLPLESKGIPLILKVLIQGCEYKVVLGGCGELCDQAVRSAGTREGRGGRGAQVRTPPILSESVRPLPQPCSAQTRAEPPGTPPGRLREEFALLTPPSPDRGSGGARLPPKGNLATSRPGAARPGFGPLGNLFFSRPEIPPPPELSLLGPASVPPVPSPACSQPSSSSVHFVNVCI